MHKKLHETHSTIFDYAIYLIYFLYFAIYLGLFAGAPQYLKSLNTLIKIYISLFLIFRFNPWREVKFTQLDKKITYNAAIYLLTTTLLTEFTIAYIDEIKNFVNNKFHISL
jgi:hypothetical protein